MLPSWPPSTDHTSGVVNPSFWVQVGIEKSRKRSRPLRVATQICLHDLRRGLERNPRRGVPFGEPICPPYVRQAAVERRDPQPSRS